MSLSSLRSFSGAASFATSAFDTARTTFKAMAEAAVPPAGSDGAARTGAGRAGSDGAGRAGADAAGRAGADTAGRTAAGRAGAGGAGTTGAGKANSDGAGRTGAGWAGSGGASRIGAGRAGSDAAGERHQAAPFSPPTGTGTGVGEVRREAERSPAEKRKAGVRKGLALDAYA